MRSRAPNTSPREDVEHMRFVGWCYIAKWRGQPLMTRPEDDRPGLIFHIPNQGERNRLYALKLAKMGVTSGVPDFVLPVRTPKYGGLWIELKRRHGGSVTPNQRERISVLRWGGQAAVVALGADACQQAVIDYLADTGDPVQVGYSRDPVIDWSQWMGDVER